MESLDLKDELVKQKLAYLHGYSNFNNFNQPLFRSNRMFWSTLKQDTPAKEEIDRTQEIVDKYDIKIGPELTMFFPI